MGERREAPPHKRFSAAIFSRVPRTVYGRLVVPYTGSAYGYVVKLSAILIENHNDITLTNHEKRNQRVCHTAALTQILLQIP